MPSKHSNLIFRVFMLLLLVFVSACGGNPSGTETSSGAQSSIVKIQVIPTQSLSAKSILLLRSANYLNGTVSFITMAARPAR